MAPVVDTVGALPTSPKFVTMPLCVSHSFCVFGFFDLCKSTGIMFVCPLAQFVANDWWRKKVLKSGQTLMCNLHSRAPSWDWLKHFLKSHLCLTSSPSLGLFSVFLWFLLGAENFLNKFLALESLF